MASARPAHGRPADDSDPARPPVPRTNFVYYLRRDGLIKIGWTGDLKTRMRALRPDELLAVEPGCIHIETGRHHQFAAIRVREVEGVEWFAPEPELLGHIAQMASLYPTPDLLDPDRPAQSDVQAAIYAVLGHHDLDTAKIARLEAELVAVQVRVYHQEHRIS